MESAQTVAKLCSRCGQNPPSNGSPWCRKCRTDHEKNRQATQAEMLAAQNWAAGVRAFRENLARSFARRPGYTVECTAVSEFIMKFPAPDKKEPASAGDTDAGEQG